MTTEDPLGLAGRSRDIDQNAFEKGFKKAGKVLKRNREQSQKLLNKIFAPIRAEKMRRKWDFIE